MDGSIIKSAVVRKAAYVAATIWNLTFGAFVLLNAYYGWVPAEEVAVWGTAASFIFNSPALGLAVANTVTHDTFAEYVDYTEPDGGE